jgi:hypothetical protein
MSKIITNPFNSFWMGGYECSDQLNVHGDRVDFLNITRHLELINQDYQGLVALGVRVVREGVRWNMAEPRPYQYDFTVLKQMIFTGNMHGIQQIWDLCHFGFPDDLTPLHPHFSKRFAAFCSAFATFFRENNPGAVLIVTPINEVGFISWLGGEVGATSPFCHHNGWKVKYAYIKAYIGGIEALRLVDPHVRILTTEPLISIVAAEDSGPSDIDEAAFHHDLQFQALDMLCGRLCPELGGKEDNLDLLGFNYYYDNQWIHTPHQVIGWNDYVPHPKYTFPSELLYRAHMRYNRPVLLSETSHPGEDRDIWIRHIIQEATKLLNCNIPIWGICLYPIIDRPDWDNLDQWHHAGIWDRTGNAPDQIRVIHQPSVEAIKEAQFLTASAQESSASQKVFYAI